MTTIVSIPVKKIGRSIDVDTTRLIDAERQAEWPAVWNDSARLRYALIYGLTQTLNDAHASLAYPANSADAIMGTVQKKLDAVYAGTVRTGGTGGESGPVDPVVIEARKLARVAFMKNKKEDREAAVAQMRNMPAFAKYAAGKKRDSRIVAAIVRVMARDESIMATARENVARAAALPTTGLAAMVAAMVAPVPAVESAPTTDNESDDDDADDDTTE